jgi:uncharacterized protein with HEPN domain
MGEDRDFRVSLDDILEALEKIMEYVDGVSEREFENNTEKQDAVIRRIEVLGEAVKNIPFDFRDKHPDIPWRSIAGMRDVVIHQYFGVTISLVWKVATSDVPAIREKIEKIIEEME